MAKKMLIDATHAEETRVVVVDGTKVEEFDFESENKRQLAGNIYLAKVTRVEPSLQAAFIDYGGNRHGFLAFSEIHPDYYQIPVADREALLAEERAYAKAMAEEDEKPKPKRRRRSRSRSKAEEVKSDDLVETKEVENNGASGMDVVDLGEDSVEGSSPMELVAETPVDTPESGEADEAAKIETPAEAPVEDARADDADTTDDADGEDEPLEATEKDDRIESVADDDAPEELRPVRKPRPRRYKIQEVIKVRQILLVQVVKEERGNKGAALTTYLSLAGRYCVLMPNTARGGGISRKITNAADRKKLKAIANEIEVPEGAGLIVRTAGAKSTKSEIKRDYEYLQRLWEEIRALTLKSIAPAKIYEEGNLIKRSIRDLYNREIDEVLVEGEEGYRVAKDFMKMIMPSHAKNVKLYNEAMPLFARYQVEGYLASMFNPTVQLKSGGYIVIGITEALVAIDVNSGRSTKEGSIEDTALKTNLEASDEVARQLRLRDLAGLIVIDYIDMDERRNNNAVEKRLKDRLKNDRARIQVGRISGFGLMEMSRQRLRPGMIEATTQPCSHCHGTGLIRSDENLALSILRQLEEEGTRKRSREVLLKAPVGIANYLMNNKREHIAQIEARYGMSVRIEADPFLVSPDFSIEKFKTASRVVKQVSAPVVSGSAAIMDDIDDAEVVEEETPVEAVDEGEGEAQPKKRRRRRRRRRGRGGDNAEARQNGEDAVKTDAAPEGEAMAEDAAKDEAVVEAPAGTEEKAEDEKPKRKPRKRAPRKSAKAADAEISGAKPDEAASEEAAPEEAAEEPKKKPVRRRRKKADAEDAPKAEEAAKEAPEAEVAAEEEKPAPKKRTRRKPAAKKAKVEEVETAPAEDTAPVAEAKPEPIEVKPEPKAAPEPVEVKPEPKSDKPKRKGWWSLGR
ncbi:Rne/Rng family ribonuclease [Profundibacter sp.]|uniref:Rne/Rng family ribonuclease n=1 Tax=Profundibacter sp. TaxID=3101071 RepID=UPI003D12B158